LSATRYPTDSDTTGSGSCVPAPTAAATSVNSARVFDAGRVVPPDGLRVTT